VPRRPGRDNPPGGNANATSVDATVWIEIIAGTDGNRDVHQLQYSRRAIQEFNGRHWPHVSVGTLRKR
jgi:hypothetical protein